MRTTCDQARQWLASQGVGEIDFSQAEEASCAAHFASCKECKALHQRMDAFVLDSVNAFSFEPSADAEQEFLQAAGDLDSYTTIYSDTVDTFRDDLLEEPSAAAETDFLNAARAQHETRTAPNVVPIRWRRPALAAALAAGLLVALWPFPEENPAPPSTTQTKQYVALPVLSLDSIQGKVLLNGEDATRRSGDAIRKDTVVETLADSTLTLDDPETALLTLSPASRISILNWTQSDSLLKLEIGTINAMVKHRAPGQRFEIQTPYARIRVVGTEFSVTHRPGEGTTVRTTSGRVRVETLDAGLLGSVGAGESLTVQAPIAAKKPVVEVAQVEPAVPAPQPVQVTRAVESPPKARPLPVQPPGHRTSESASPSFQTETIVRGRGDVTKTASPQTTDSRYATHNDPKTEAPTEQNSERVSHDTTGHLQSPAPSRNEGSADLPLEEKKPATVEPQVALLSPPLKRKPRIKPLQKARKLLAEGHDAEAIELLNRVERGSWHRDALLGDAYRLAGKYHSAESAYRDALHLSTPPPARVLADLASLHESHLHNRKDATKAWKRYLMHYPGGGDAARAHMAIGEHSLANGDVEEAKKHFKILIENFSRSQQSIGAFAKFARILLDEGDWAAAEAFFKPIANSGTGKKTETALVGLIRVRVAQGRRANARTLITEYRKRFPEGRRSEEVGHLETALK